MKLLMIIGSAEIGGAERQVIQLATRLRTKIDVTLAFINAKGPLLSSDVINKLKYIDINISKKNSFKKNLFNYFNYLNFLRKNNFNICHAFLPESILLTWPYLIFFKRKTIRVSGIRGSHIRRNFLIKILYYISIKLSHSVTFNSFTLLNFYVQKLLLKYSKCVFIPNGVELKIAKKNMKRNEKHGVVVSNLHDYKGHDILLKAMTISQIFNIDFLGDGPLMNSLKLQASVLGLSERINFRGIVDVNKFLANYSFAVHPSRTEGLSNAVIECLSFGIPVVAFDVGGNSELIKNGYNGYVVSRINHFDLAKSINTLLLNKKKILFYQNAIDSVQHLSWERITNLYFKYYTKLLFEN